MRLGAAAASRRSAALLGAARRSGSSLSRFRSQRARRQQNRHSLVPLRLLRLNCFAQLSTDHKHRYSIHAQVLYDSLLQQIPQKRKYRRIAWLRPRTPPAVKKKKKTPACFSPLQIISQTTLFLAAKVEEQPRKLEHVVKIAHACINPQEPALDTKSNVSAGWSRDTGGGFLS